ncbi:Zinc finger RING/FYVE/PHD-type protein [Dioscorea alata]|uniref:Zinc finger RING/FYVE/PHD-type protein n=1 Tax=Dioscorea alata TaxID=55571 RepID=A0ACB7WB91_DIOAL|nr:Zinc finger RING/FYVE/PHD-type protein [Dioscorea alata]
MDAAEIEESLFVNGDAKLHGEMCRKLSTIVGRVLAIFPALEAGRPRSKSGIQALCSLHVSLDKAKNLLIHCSECSKLYLAITGDSILMKFKRVRCSLLESLRRVEGIVPEDIGCQIMEIVGELEETMFTLDESEKAVGDEVISLLQKDRQCNGSLNDNEELEVFHQCASRLGITSSRSALAERRALKKLIERARAEEDKRKESIVSYLLRLMRKYSKIFRSEIGDDTDSQGSTPRSPTVLGSFEEISCAGTNGLAFERQLSKLRSFNFKQNSKTSGNMPIPPEEFRCPISLQLMSDPVIISSGQTYERICIEKWFNDGHSTCPKTQQQLCHLSLTPNYCVKGLIASWCEQNGIPIPCSPPESVGVSYSRLALEGTDSQSIGSVDSCKPKGIMMHHLDESCISEELGGNGVGTLEDNSSCQDRAAGELESYDSLLTVLYEGKSARRRCRAVEQLRFLLKDDEEARIYAGANGFVDALIHFLQSAIDEGDLKSQEAGAMALFNLAVNNNRNKGMLLSAGVMPLLEQMIFNTQIYESATALYLNLSCLDDAKPIIGSSQAVTFLVQLLQADSSASTSCKHDALYTLYNLSTHPSNIPSLLASGIVDALYSLLVSSAESSRYAWAEKTLAVLINLASSKAGKHEIVSTSSLIGALATLLDTGESSEQEQAVSCLLILCNGDEICSQMVLQEGVIPALVSISVSGTARGIEKAQKLLKLFREQRQSEPALACAQQHNENCSNGNATVSETKSLCVSKSKKFSRTLSSMWKNRTFSVYHC